MIPLYKVFSYILYCLHTGCRRYMIPAEKDNDGRPEISRQAVYYHFRKRCRDGSFKNVRDNSIDRLTGYGTVRISPKSALTVLRLLPRICQELISMLMHPLIPLLHVKYVLTTVLFRTQMKTGGTVSLRNGDADVFLTEKFIKTASVPGGYPHGLTNSDVCLSVLNVRMCIFLDFITLLPL